MSKLFGIICILACLTLSKAKEGDIITKLLENYDESVAPTGPEDEDPEQDPVIIYVQMFLRRIEIDDSEQEHTVQLTLRQFWTDKRLAFHDQEGGSSLPYVTLDANNVEHKIWKPDTFFPNDVEDESSDDEAEMANQMIRIKPDGEVTYSQRITSTFACPMSAQEYPFDEQTCHIDVASYGHTVDHVMYKWKKEHPISLKAGIKMMHFELTNYTTSYYTTKTESGEYNGLRATLQFDRQKTMESHKVFGYSVALVFASWIPFWLKPCDTAARAVIGVCCLAATIFFNHLMTDEQLIENVSYVTALHVWTDATLGFVFLALAQLAIVALLTPRSPVYVNAGVGGVEQGEVLIRRQGVEEAKLFAVPFKDYHWGQRLDIICRLIFPLAYLIFNIVYWSIYSE